GFENGSLLSGIRGFAWKSNSCYAREVVLSSRQVFGPNEGSSMRNRSLLVLAVVMIPAAHACPARAISRVAPSPARAQTFDYARRIDVNQVGMAVTNVGSLGVELPGGTPGLEFPRGSGKTAVRASGLWLGAKVGGPLHIAV